MERAGSIQGLGEIALRVEDLDGMTAFYEKVVGLKLLQRFPNAAFFRIADGFAGHTQVLALFDRTSESDYRGLSRAQTTVDHFAFEIALHALASEKARLGNLGIEIETAEHAWVHWRSLYFRDPEGNQIEFVCYDPAVKE